MLLQKYPTRQIITSLPVKVFGSTVFVHDHSQNRNRLDHTSIKYIFLGYFSTKKKRYKCYSPNARKFYTSINVTFFEDQAYYPKNPIQRENVQEWSYWLEILDLSSTKQPEIGTSPSPSPIIENTIIPF